MLRLLEGNRLILASGSPRRKQLLGDCGLQFSVLPSDAPEEVMPGESPADMVKRLSLEKARVISAKHRDAWVLGADTTVVLNQSILGKPKNEPDAVRMLSQLQGVSHEVWGGFSIICESRGVLHTESAMSRVTMLPISQQEICAYVETGEPMDKAGSYAIQGLGAQYVARVEGSYTNVVGLDLPQVIAKLKEFKVIGW